MSNPDRLEDIRRRRAIYAMRAEGSTSRAIGLHFGISVARVRQLLRYVERERKKYGDVTPEELHERKLAEAAEVRETRKLARAAKECGPAAISEKCAHGFITPEVCPVCQMIARMRKERSRI